MGYRLNRSNILREGPDLCENFDAFLQCPLRKADYMLPVITFFWRLCTLRAHPGEVPAAAWFMTMIAFANVSVSILLSMQWSPDSEPLRLATSIVSQQAALACLVWISLYLRSMDRRFAATITAIFGCDLLLTGLLGALSPVVLDVAVSVRQTLLFLFFIWSMTIIGHILHQALEVRFLAGVAIAFGMTLFSSAIGSAVLE